MATPQVQSVMDIASSLSTAEIPVKLRCCTCDGVAVNAWKLPCCDQSICETCQASLPETCPVCQHSPLDATMCKPNKALRTTVKAFLRTEEKKRSKEAASAAPAVEATPVAQEASNTPVPSIEQPQTSEQEAPDVSVGATREDQQGQCDAVTRGAEITPGDGLPVEPTPQNVQEYPQESERPAEIKEASDQPTEEQEQTLDNDANDQSNAGEQQQQQDADNSDQQQNMPSEQQDGQGQQQTFTDGSATPSNQPTFTGMEWNAASSAGNFNPMMMNNMGYGYPNMMGMTGMNMNAMMPQSMYSGYGPMAMGNMGMGMGFGGFGGAWNGQGFGGNSGYYPNAGYNGNQTNQGPYGSQMQQNFSHHQNQNQYHNRGGYGRGRGRGGYGGRGGQWAYQNQNQMGQYGNQHMGNEQFSQEMPAGYQGRRGSQMSSAEPSQQRPQSRSGMSVEANPTESSVVPDQTAVARATGDEPPQPMEAPDQSEQLPSHNGDDTINSTNNAIQALQDGEANYAAQPADGNHPQIMADQPYMGDQDANMGMNMNGDAFLQTSQAYGGLDGMSVDGAFYGANQQPYSFNARGRGGFGRGGFRGRGGFGHNMQGAGYGTNVSQASGDFTVLTGANDRAPSPPINAPTGPKAMREGLPNSGIYSRPGFGAKPQSQVQPSAEVQSPPEEITLMERERSISPAKEPSDRDHEDARSRSQSHSRKRKHRNRSVSANQEDEAQDRKRERRRHHEGKYDDESRGHAVGDRESRDHPVVDRDSKKDYTDSVRSRSRSPIRDDDSSKRHRRRDEKRHSSRSRRDHSKERSRRHRHRSRSPGHREKDRDRERDRDRDRDRERDKDRKRSRRDRSTSRDPHDKDRDHRDSRRSRHSRDERKDREPEPEKEAASAPADDVGFKIKGSRATKTKPGAADTATFAPPTGPKKDRQRDDRPSKPSEPTKSATPAADPYALEREARMKERMDREKQRREGGGTNTKRGRGSFDGDNTDFAPPTGPKADKDISSKRRRSDMNGQKGRRMSYKYEDDDRAAQVEKEREAGRWR